MPVAWEMPEAIQKAMEATQVDKLLEVLSQAPPQLSVPAKLAALPIIAGKRNPKFTNLIRNLYTWAENFKPNSKAQFMEAFFKARHPNLAKRMSTSIKDPEKWTMPEAAGVFHQNVNKYEPRIGTISVKDDPNYSLTNLADIFTHEATHGIQFKRKPQIFDDYVQSTDDYQKYYNHPSEVEARKGGTRGVAEFNELKTYVINEALKQLKQDEVIPYSAKAEPKKYKEIQKIAIKRALERKEIDKIVNLNEAFENTTQPWAHPRRAYYNLLNNMGEDEAGRVLELAGLKAIDTENFGKAKPLRSIKDLIMEIPATYNRIIEEFPLGNIKGQRSKHWRNLK
jgi:hypothetical protein